MSDDDGSNGGGWPAWLKWSLGVVAAVITLVLLSSLFGFVLKWGLIALAIYAVFLLGRRLLSGSSGEVAEGPKLLTDESREPDQLLEFEKDQQLEEFKARIEADKGAD